ncbi:MAG: 50S ribosomal protein L9 [Nitrosomonas sp.]|jgi:large subunit ribosomal protein L9|uniref:50S ribosomal protein L9 n=1 Tax=Nitrosomonas sp. TaxID=42353 RepID=UPI00272FD37B|nr:50S ribosomal protein L9 [Nitrosomonas sp.]MBK6957497.1 50S ribosomal protein L9 [Nitrosomonas sp.]MDP1550894.1 50S ribosomal protein L9 [Nitrosomonas sp.]MDP1933778.1 50S ribosomal protein L9 [Nitrosomonas sp.]MDP3280015.1 50S ribosomal protein L9 [Nitrosomonas sp.]MDP3663523.1 50S ribosomal protein L9 [Nitrosomonas sp.]
MQIILMEKVANLGQLGDIVNVKSGFARNYLIPQGKAKRATEQAIAEFQSKRAELEKVQAAALAAAQAMAAKLDGLLVQISQKAGSDGKLFGSVTNANIAEALAGQGFVIERAMIHMPNGQLKQVGDYPLTISLHSDVSAHITVSVLGEAIL